MNQPPSTVPKLSANQQSLCRAGRYGTTQEISLAFFSALNACVTQAPQFQPIIARNSNLYPAWVRWANMLEGEPVNCVADALLTDTRRRFDLQVDLLGEMIKGDPSWRSGRINPCGGLEKIEASLVLTSAALLFWARRRALLVTTEALEQLLVHSDLGDDLPIGLFRPPVPACFIRFGKTLQDAVVPAAHHQNLGGHTLQGVYVFEAERKAERTIAIVPIFEMATSEAYAASTIELLIIDEERSLAEQIKDVCRNSDQGEHFASIAQIVAKVFFYMALPQVVLIEERPYSAAVEQLRRVGAKKAARLVRQLPRLVDRFVLGPHEALAFGHGALSPHLRRGHFRLQPYGPESSRRKVIFIAPTWVRADRLTTA